MAADPAPATPTAADLDTPPTSAQTADAAKVAGQDRVVCRKETKANSRFTTKVCKTVAEWEQRAETAKQAFGETQNRPVISIDRGS